MSKTVTYGYVRDTYASKVIEKPIYLRLGRTPLWRLCGRSVVTVSGHAGDASRTTRNIRFSEPCSFGEREKLVWRQSRRNSSLPVGHYKTIGRFQTRHTSGSITRFCFTVVHCVGLRFFLTTRRRRNRELSDDRRTGGFAKRAHQPHAVHK